MANRSDEKKRLREEREAAERAAATKAARAKRLQMVGGAIVAIAAVAILAFVLVGSGDDGGDSGASTNEAKAAVPPPGDLIRNLPEAAKEAGCELKSFPSEGRTHIDEGTEVDYKTNPPTSGAHRQVAAEDGRYAAGNEPDPRNWVHSLEHGRVLVQYKPGTPQGLVDQLETVASEEVSGSPGYHVLTFQNNTKMPFAVAAVSWTKYLGCTEMNPKVFDAIRAFRNANTDKAPEFIP